MKVLHLIGSLETGGAEMMLYKLMSRRAGTRTAPVVVSMTTLGALGPRIRDLGVPVYALGVTRRKRLPGLIGLLRILRR